MKHLINSLLLLISAVLVGCDSGPNASPRGFSLPQGDVEQGRLVLHKYQCLSCHVIKGEVPQDDVVKNTDYVVQIGGKTARQKTYADLLTSVINPSHKVTAGYGKYDKQQRGMVSDMRIYNDLMTVTELVDLVTYLETHYELMHYQRTVYSNYGY
ncbi:cytochrome C [Paraferrimonas sp. SM1919]|uniref:cytochrome C n=1 Tax=Paraferrimonas sp. SM1919 TaxID=2662263 RepID=UPI0013D4BC8B|nr:cytochrome C [Paraferrimonas sp. SM1919]